jgi:hypothetical protein
MWMCRHLISLDRCQIPDLRSAAHPQGRGGYNRYARSPSPSSSSDSDDRYDRSSGPRGGGRKQNLGGGGAVMSAAEERRRARRLGRFGSGRAGNLHGGEADGRRGGPSRRDMILAGGDELADEVDLEQFTIKVCPCAADGW